MGKKKRFPGLDASLDRWSSWVRKLDQMILLVVTETPSPNAAKKAAMAKGMSEREAKKAVHLAQLKRDNSDMYRKVMLRFPGVVKLAKEVWP